MAHKTHPGRWPGRGLIVCQQAFRSACGRGSGRTLAPTISTPASNNTSYSMEPSQALDAGTASFDHPVGVPMDAAAPSPFSFQSAPEPTPQGAGESPHYPSSSGTMDSNFGGMGGTDSLVVTQVKKRYPYPTDDVTQQRSVGPLQIFGFIAGIGVVVYGAVRIVYVETLESVPGITINSERTLDVMVTMARHRRGTGHVDGVEEPGDAGVVHRQPPRCGGRGTHPVPVRSHDRGGRGASVTVWYHPQWPDVLIATGPNRPSILWYVVVLVIGLVILGASFFSTMCARI